MSVIAQVLDVRHNDEEVYLSCFNSEVERSVPAMKLPMHGGEPIRAATWRMITNLKTAHLPRLLSCKSSKQ